MKEYPDNNLLLFNKKDKKKSSIIDKDTNTNTNNFQYQYIFYILFILLIYFGFYLNYLKTNNANDEKMEYFYLNPNKVCENNIQRFQRCLQNLGKKLMDYKGELPLNYICKSENDKLQKCFDELRNFCHYCQIYLNELYDCKLKSRGYGYECIGGDALKCWNKYTTMNFSIIYELL